MLEKESGTDTGPCSLLELGASSSGRHSTAGPPGCDGETVGYARSGRSRRGGKLHQWWSCGTPPGSSSIGRDTDDLSLVLCEFSWLCALASFEPYASFSALGSDHQQPNEKGAARISCSSRTRTPTEYHRHLAPDTWRFMGSYKWGYKGLGFLLRVSIRVLYCLRKRVVESGFISPLIWVISIVVLLITLLITTHEPPSNGVDHALQSFVQGPWPSHRGRKGSSGRNKPTNTLSQTHAYIHTYLLTYAHPYIHAYLLTYMHTHIIYMLSYIHTRRHTYLFTFYGHANIQT